MPWAPPRPTVASDTNSSAEFCAIHKARSAPDRQSPAEITIAQKKISRFNGLECFAAPDPQQVLQRGIIQPAEVKRIPSINQRQEIIIAIRAMDKRVNE